VTVEVSEAEVIARSPVSSGRIDPDLLPGPDLRGKAFLRDVSPRADIADRLEAATTEASASNQHGEKTCSCKGQDAEAERAAVSVFLIRRRSSWLLSPTGRETRR
jgi:hypothetical protein